MSDHFRGHRVEIWDGVAYYCDTGEPTATTARRPCGRCGQDDTPEGHDGCLGELPRDIVMNACCGHGEDDLAYIQYWDRSDIRGPAAIEEQRRLKWATLP